MTIGERVGLHLLCVWMRTLLLQILLTIGIVAHLLEGGMVGHSSSLLLRLVLFGGALRVRTLLLDDELLA